MQQLAKTSELVAGVYSEETMYKGIREMAEANYIRMTMIVMNDLLVQRAFLGQEERHLELMEGVL
ncbi:hypothetical protein [Paenibacillus sacheonensis]|uniref:Uncharacterized protein n=1 Tax=Paenibacillus sacheonensis TaxID=742054 RepID=A0A7X4YTA7_9BACL|nr:hypothetical protein [Paenibacillus sacheonensis]MBM7565756.1 hypothetical protein [Paenibacillus sacheonensis]NBC72187.1 hypothetical protein [Paenibacillus sacheonensis]